MDWIFWALLAAVAVHVMEQYVGSFVSCSPRPAARFRWFNLSFNLLQFALVNAGLLAVALAAALIWPEHPVFCLSLPALLLVNTCLHLVPMVATRRYSPGSVSAVLLFVPLGLYAFRLADEAGLGGTATVLAAFALAAFWMLLALASSLLWWAVGDKTGR